MSKKKSLAETHPHLLKEWDYKQNTIKPSDITHGYSKKVFWICKDCKFNWKATPNARTKKNPTGCPQCRWVTKDNNLAKTNPHLIPEWDFDKNTIKPTHLTYGSVISIYWKCVKFGHSWQATPNSRTSRKRKDGKPSGCPKCAGNEVLKENSLLALFPNIAKELHPSNKFKANEITAHSTKRGLWECSKCEYQWSTKIQSRTNKQKDRKPSGCPSCAKSIPSKKYNFAVIYPERLKYWDYKRNRIKPNQITPHSSVEIYWVCEKNHQFERW